MIADIVDANMNKMLSYRRETALQGALQFSPKVEDTIIGWKSAISLQRGPVDPKFQVEEVAPHQPIFFSEN